MKTWPRQTGRQSGIALVIVLSFVVLLTIVVVAYFSRVLNSRQIANDSLNSGKTDQLARNALEVIVNDFKQEIVNGSTPTTIPATGGVTTYYPSARANMVPMRSGNPGTPPFTTTNPDPVPNLIRRSIRTDTMAVPGVASRASAVNSASDAAANGRVVSLARWNKHYLVPQADATGNKPDPLAVFTAPDWVMMTKEEGPVVLSAPNRDAAGNTVTPVGRYAYAVYDEGGLLDANVAGFPTNMTPAQYGTKGTLALADLTQLPIKPNAATHPADYLPQQSVIDQIIGWRNYASAQPGGIFGGFSFDAAGATRYYTASGTDTSGFLKTSTSVYQNRTDQKFFSRGQLIAFQQSFPQTPTPVFPASVLQYLGTFSRELNAPSWGPTQNAVDIDPHGTSGYAYKDNRSTTYAYNRLLTEVRYAKAGTIKSYHTDGTPYTYAVKAGDPLVQRRFPLARLGWLGPTGPNSATGGTADNILACFGLQWTTTGWQYVVAPDANDPTLTSDPYASIIRKLGSVASEALPREPNFFELLQEGMLSGSLGLSPESPVNSNADSYNTIQEAWIDLNVFRIGASIITQVQQLSGSVTKYYPTVVQYTRSGTTFSAVGIDDLPYLSMFHMLAGKNPATTDLNCFLMFGLWNPHQIIAGTAARPPVRLRVAGTVVLENKYGTYPDGVVNVYNTYKASGYAINLSGQVNLATGSGVGVNGFADPHTLLPADLQPAPTAGDSTGKTWATLPAMRDGTVYAGYRLPDFSIDTTKKPPNPADFTPVDYFLWSILEFWANTNSASPFNCWLEYQAADNTTWIPYTYHAGIENTGLTGLSKQPGFYAAYMGPSYPAGTKQGDAVSGLSPVPLAIDPPAGASNSLYYTKYPWGNTDPRSLRFNYTQEQTPGIPTDNLKYLSASIWGPLTESYVVPNTSTPAIGRPSSQNIPTIFLPPSSPVSLAPAGTARNNNTVAVPPNSASPAAYYDQDGVRRIADSGLFTDPPTATNNWAGDPYALADPANNYPAQPHRVSDRPVILHRPFANVAELGYVSRDYPWRTLDFFSNKSADAGLLDIFTTSPSSEAVSAGRINLNSRNVTALNAVLSQSVTDILPTTLTVLTKPQTIAADLVALTNSTTGTDGPFIGKDEIVTRFVGGKLSSGTLGSDFSSTDEQNIKVRREAVTRSLAEVGQTRTWNLLVDVVAQSGRYASGATKLGQFSVEGERHYWLHVAIDRFTGEVVDQQLEAVTE